MTLREVFSSIANAIRSKTGKYDTIKPVDMATEIESIQTSGVFNRLPQVVDNTITIITADDLVGATKIRDFAFRACSLLTQITIPNSVTRIGQFAFYECSSLTQITIPNSVTFIGESAFRACSSLTQITIPDSITSISAEVFDYCKKLVSVTLPNNLTYIGNYCFDNCEALTSITIPVSVNYIGPSALDIGTPFKKATITMKPTTPPTIDSNTFTTNKLNKIIVPVGCGDIYKSATDWSNFADYIEEATA